MPGREKLKQMKGNRSYRYCNYCTIKGVYNGVVYCTFRPPEEPPDTDKVNKAKNSWKTYDRNALPIRNDHTFRVDAAHIMETINTAASDQTGIKRLLILYALQSIDFPRSFLPDAMHVYFENVF
jgi:hypothetical protein